MLEQATDEAHTLGDNLKGGECYRDKVIPAMAALRKTCDEIELNMSKEYYPMPTYGDLLFSVH